MDRALFFELGAYDPEMKLYGGEEMEISFRIWQCGGTLECIPCSRVGHVFRTGRYCKGQVYPVAGHVIIRNKLRAAYMWMDKYAKIANNVMGDLPEGNTVGDLGWAKLRNTCLNGGPSHSFKWFLDNVYPEMMDVLAISRTGSSGQIKNPATDGCLDTMGRHSSLGEVGAYPCHGQHGTQEFLLDKEGQIRVALMDFTSCVGSRDHSEWPVVARCAYEGSIAHAGFEWNQATGSLKNRNNGLCLTVSAKEHDNSPLSVRYEPCTKANKGQEWTFNSTVKLLE
jgi:polypeptide N-acetylgalactosaminyltransferase